MKLHFEPNLDYQLHTIESVCDLFRGWEASIPAEQHANRNMWSL